MTQSGTLEDFIQQVPPSIINLLVFLALGLILTTIALVFIRVRRGQMKNNPNSRFFGNFDPMASLRGNTDSTNRSPSPATSGSDLPDLDMLLGNAVAPAPASNNSVMASAAAPHRQPGIVDIRMSDGHTVEAAEMLVLARDRRTDNLIVQIGEQAYDGTEEGVSADFKRKFVKLMRELSDIAPTLQTVSQAEPPKPQTPRPTPSTTAPTSAVPVPVALSQSSPTFPEINDTETEADEAPGTFNLAAQIEAFLQQRLRNEPDLVNRSIHVLGAPGGGVRIEVDGSYYEAVDDVEDEQVRAYLQETIAQWQAG